MPKNSLLLFLLLLCMCTSHTIAQIYFVGEGYTALLDKVNKMILNNDDCSAGCEMMYLGTGFAEDDYGYTMTPASDLIAYGEGGLFTVDTIDGSYFIYFSVPIWPNWPWTRGIVTSDGVRFYTISTVTPFYPGMDTLYEMNVNTGIITSLGHVSYSCYGEITLFNGEMYYITRLSSNPNEFGIVRLDINNPDNSTLVAALPLGYHVFALSATNICNTLISINDWEEIVFINLLDGAITPKCELSTPSYFSVLSTMQEFYSPTACDVSLDLDCDDSSGATDADFNSDDVNCFDHESTVADIDVGMQYDAVITEMRVEITGFMPDAPFEILTSTGSVANIDVSGDGTDLITLSNAGGARSTDFKDALRFIRYQNNAGAPSGSLRTVEVQFTTESGSQSNVATAFINVIELPQVPVNLGGDLQVCEGESAIFDTGIPGATYEWSTGDDTQTIAVSEAGEYIVTVADGENCPGIDTVVLEVLPVIDISLSGDTEICDNEQATIIINTSTPFGLNIDISSEPGSPFNFPDVTETTSFTDLVNEETTYTITSVTPSQDACISISDPEHIVDVYPSFLHAFDVAICEGDSVWLGFYWETETGIYQNTFETFDGCDSVVTTTIAVLPEIPVEVQSYTCDTASVGIFVTVIDNPAGCDTIITEMVTLASLDTTSATAVSCRIADTGISQSVLPGSDGCDSLVILTTSYLPPSDTTFLAASTCDSANLGIMQLITASANGCDSLIVINTTLSTPDTTYTFSSSCDSASIGTFQSSFQNQDGCDSLVITTITAGRPDTTYTSSTSCDSATLGTFEYHLTSVTGCDSIVFQTITFSAQDSTFISGTTCDPAIEGVSVQSFINQFGCDSIVTTTTSLLASDTVSLSGSTCDPAQAGINIQELQNINGCDSIVTTTISLLPSDATAIFETTCISADVGVWQYALTNIHGCDSIVMLNVSLVDADTTRLSSMTCLENEVGITESLFTGIDGCDSVVIEQTLLFILPHLNVQSLQDYNGYDVSCAGGADGGAVALLFAIPPYSYEWSTSGDEQTITGLTSGHYAVTITDGNGCKETGEVTLTEPSALALAFSISEPDCFENALGSIDAIASGGVPPYAYSLDGTNFQSSSAFQHLQNGVYQVTIRDANDCIISEIVSIHVPLSIQVELGDDQIISIGDSAEITAVVNLPFDSIASIDWHNIDSIECLNCLTKIVAPIITTAYSISVSSVDGCADADTITVHVSTDHNFYIPNIFSPNGDGINDVIAVHISDDVEAILAFSIFDRWGNLVFERNATEQVIEWDGRFNGKTLNPGVFTYMAKVKYRDGSVERRYGDITLVR